MAISLHTRICLRNDQAARWAELNPVLLKGEIGIEIDTGLFKIGDGTKKFSELSYANNKGGGESTLVSTDGKTIVNKSGTISLNNWGIKYYAYNAATKTYSVQVVDEEHPWLSNLTPRVAEEDGQLVLAWYQPGADADAGTLLQEVETLKTQIGTSASTDTNTIWGAINGKLSTSGGTLLGDLVLNDGSPAASKAYVAEQISNINALKRQIVEELPAVENADPNTIYMIKTGTAVEGDNYKEYMLVEGAFELIGDTSADLTNYIKKPETFATNNLPIFGEDGGIKDSGIAAANLSAHLLDTVQHLTEAEHTKLTNLLPIFALDDSLAFTDDGKLKVAKAGIAEIPIATAAILGGVKSSTSTNEVAVDADTGIMSLNSVSVSKLVNEDGVELILNGGNAG